MSELLRVESPFSGEVVAEVRRHDAAEVEATLARAVEAQVRWEAVPVAERVRRVRRAMGYFRDAADEVARDVSLQMGKPLAQARNEIEGLFERTDHMLAIAEQALAPDVLPEKQGFHRRIERVPLGVVLDVAAWNYPLLIPVNVVVPALVAGNACLLKHSRRTPGVGEHFQRALGALEPEGLFAHLVLDHEATLRLMGDERVGYVAFTGSVRGGRAVQEATAARFVDTGLELGGKDPAYVAPDADLETAVPGIVDGACYNAGQSCCAVERVYVHESLVDEFLERARRELEAYVLGDPLEATTTMGPLADPAAPAFLAEQVADAQRRGARLLAGGEPQGRFFAPTLLADCPPDSDVLRTESFGPLVPVVQVADEREALARMNDSDLGLTASVWTRDDDRAEWFARRLQAGTVFQNRCDYLDPALAWTGFKDSGKGVTLSRHGYAHLTRAKSVHRRLATP